MSAPDLHRTEPPPVTPSAEAVPDVSVTGPRTASGTTNQVAVTPVRVVDQLGSAVVAAWRSVTEPITAVGWAVFATMVLSWIVGWWFGWFELMMIAAAALFCLVVACGFIIGSTKLDVRVDLSPSRVVVGKRAAGQVFVTNPTAHRTMPSRLELVVGAGAAEFSVPSLAAGAEHEELFVLPTQRRGVIPVGPAITVKGDPLGLLRRSVPWTEPQPLYVHPRTTHLGHLGAGFLRDLEGQPTPDLSPSDIAFHTLREYQHGDDRRFVHWMTSARVGQLMVRQFTDTRRAHLAVVLDTTAGAYRNHRDEVCEEFELAVSIAGSLGVRAISDEQDVTMATGGHVLPSVNGPTMLDGLAAASLQRRGNLVRQADQVVRNTTGVSLAVVITGPNTSIADLRAATIRFPSDVRTLAIQIDPEQPTGLRPVGATTVMTVASLDELARLTWVATQS